MYQKLRKKTIYLDLHGRLPETPRPSVKLSFVAIITFKNELDEAGLVNPLAET